MIVHLWDRLFEYFLVFKQIKYRISPFLLSPLFLIAQQNDLSHEIGFNIKYSEGFTNKYSKFHPSDIYGDGIYSKIRLNFNNLSIVNSLYVTSDSIQAMKGTVREVKNLYGYMNQAYLLKSFYISNIKNEILFGRQYYKVGYGKRANLLVGDGSRPFDQIRLTSSYKDFTMNTAWIQLDNINNENRYLTVATYNIDYFEPFHFILGQAMLYSGVNRNWDFNYMNPFSFMVFDSMNSFSGDGNGFLYGGILFNSDDNDWSIWSELLIDDYMINYDSKEDLEPNTIGINLGCEINRILASSSELWFEYSRVNNRTYQTANISETYTHIGFPIGHYLGNDFDMLQAQFIYNMHERKIKPWIGFSLIRDGANGLETSWDDPWQNESFTLETGYSEPFPTHPVEQIFEIESGLDYFISNSSFINISYYYQKKSLDDYNESISRLSIRISIEFEKLFKY